MRGIDMIRTSGRARLTLLTAVALVAGVALGGVALAQSAEQEKLPYRSSIQVPDDANEEKDADEAEDDSGASRRGAAGEREEEGGDDARAEQSGDEARAEQAEAARFQSLARVTSEQARAAALVRVPGTATSVALENEDGNLVYGVSVRTATGESDVKVDAGNARVLHVEKAEQDD